jgi:hypothetical protein
MRAVTPCIDNGDRINGNGKKPEEGPPSAMVSSLMA